MVAEVGDMAAPPPLDGRAGQFDLIWSESAIYNLGRSNAFETWRPMLAPGGWLVFSEIVWAGDPSRRSERASAFWTTEYPAITGIDGVTAELASAGFHPREPLVAGREVWVSYYEPLRARVAELQQQGSLGPVLAELVAGLVREIEQYDAAGDAVELVFFAAG
jgi:SAM-dependent methyltransferase